jgi:polyhydroxybutyrate depolymerase
MKSMSRLTISGLFSVLCLFSVRPKAHANNTAEEPGRSPIQSKSCSRSVPKSFPIGFTDGCISVGSRDRIYRVYQPKSSAEEQKHKAIVIVLHGGGGSGTLASNLGESPLAVFQTLAEKDHFLVVYPHGTAHNEEKTGWNDCRSDDTSKSGANDVEFLSELITQLKNNSQLKSSQVFLAGTSNGAMMAFRFAMEKSDLIGGIAGSSGNIAKNPVPGRCQQGPERPLPVLLTHGTKDGVVPADGGCVGHFLRIKCRRGEVRSAEETVQFWLKANGLSQAQPTINEIDPAKKDGGAAIERKYSDGKSVVISWLLNGAGHATPSKAVTKGNRLSGKQNHDIEFAEVSWNFFKSQMGQ